MASVKNSLWSAGRETSKSDMLASKYVKFVRISKEPTEEATTWNNLLDIDNIVKRLFSLYIEEKRKPPYLAEAEVDTEFRGNTEKCFWYANQLLGV